MFKLFREYKYGMLVPTKKSLKADNYNLEMKYEFYSSNNEIEEFTIESSSPVEENLGFIDVMNELGRRGWRLISVADGVYYFEMEK